MSDVVTTRREFLTKGLTLVGFGATVPCFVNQLAWALGSPLDAPLVASRPGVPDERVLVIVQLAGGNDGLNTVVPYDDDVYRRRRPKIALAKTEVLRLDSVVGLHPAASGLMRLWDQGKLAVVQGVGYPNPDRSHFTSTDVWETGSTSKHEHRGWIGRYFDCACGGADPPVPTAAVALTGTTPLTLQGDRFQPSEFEEARSLEWHGASDPLLEAAHDALDRWPAPGSLAAFVQRVSMDAKASAESMRRIASRASAAAYPDGALGRSLRNVARLVASGAPTRVYYVSLSGFDTHSDQLTRHAQLLAELGESIRAFVADLEVAGQLDRVLLMTFSEFGRRVAENGAGGTDHGQAAPLFVVGNKLKPGLHGAHADLRHLPEGDVRFTIDFRQVYATILDEWLRADSKAILGAPFARVPFL
jgi:uncharacterized protein (DUF1501 family)